MSPTLTSCRAIIFDCEGVIIDTEGVGGQNGIWDQAAIAFLAHYNHPYDRSVIKPLLTGRSLHAGTAILKDYFLLPGPVAELAAERKALVEQFFATQVEFVPGVLAFLAVLAPRYQTAIATALDPHLFALADRKLGLTDLFAGAVVTLADSTLRPKPFPDLFLAAAEHLGVPASACAVIEDAPHGLEAARAAGMYAIGLTTTYPRPQLTKADLVIDEFTELIPLLPTVPPPLLPFRPGSTL